MSRLTIVHSKHGSTTQCAIDCVCQNGIWLTDCNDPMCQVPGGYLRGLKQFPPNYPMPAIRYSTMLVNWHGKMQFIVVYPNQWCGYATMVANYAFERKP